MSTILPLRSDEAITFTIAILDLLAAGAVGSGAPYRSSRPTPVFLAFRLAEVNVPKIPPFWNAGSYAARRPYLLARGRITAALRAWFASRDFVEGETATLQVSPGNETHLHAFATELVGQGGDHRQLYLRTSPEFACKKLLAA